MCRGCFFSCFQLICRLWYLMGFIERWKTKKISFLFFVDFSTLFQNLLNMSNSTKCLQNNLILTSSVPETILVQMRQHNFANVIKGWNQIALWPSYTFRLDYDLFLWHGEPGHLWFIWIWLFYLLITMFIKTVPNDWYK